MTRRRPPRPVPHDDPDWLEHALCRRLIAEGEMTVDDFFPMPGQNAWRAKQACVACPVRVACLDYALKTGEVHGVWGAASEADRKRIRRKRREAASA